MLKQIITCSLILPIILLHPSIVISSQQNSSESDLTPSARREIRKFNFLNRTYYAECAGRKVKVRNGSYKPDREGPDSDFSFGFQVSVSFGDLTGDGVEEAFVVTQCSGAVQNYSTGKVYAVQNHRLVRLDQVRHGAKNDQDILEGKISRGRLIVKRIPENSPNETCFGIRTITYRMEGNKLKRVGRIVCNPD
jgi:hypothetical protein